MRYRDVFSRLREKAGPRVRRLKVVLRTGFEPTLLAGAGAVACVVFGLAALSRGRYEFLAPLWLLTAGGLVWVAFLHALDATLAVLVVPPLVFLLTMAASYYGVALWVYGELYPGIAADAVALSLASALLYTFAYLFFSRWRPVAELRGRVEPIEEPAAPPEAPTPPVRPPSPLEVAGRLAEALRGIAARIAAPPRRGKRRGRRAGGGLV